MIVKPKRDSRWLNKIFKWSIITGIVLLIVLNIFLILFNSAIFNFWSSVLSPVQVMGAQVKTSTIGLFSYFGNNRELTQKNIELSQKNAELEQKIVTLEGYETENQNLREILDLKSRKINWQFQVAEVTSQNTDSWRDIITINKGSKNGLRENQPVLTPAGLVGHIISVGADFARIELITDSQSTVGASLLSTHDIFMVEGNAKLQTQKLCKLTSVYQNNNAFAGDLVETSGVGSIYPKGIVIGKINSVKDGEIILKPAVDFSNLEQVMIITKVN